MIECRDYAAALACCSSPDQAAALTIRRRHATADVVIVEGYDEASPGG